MLISGDGDFRRLVEAVQRRGVRVTVISTIRTQPPMVADELRRQADFFLDLAELQGQVAREYQARHERYRAQRRGHADDDDDGEYDDEQALSRAPAGARIRDCGLCPRLRAFRDAQRAAEPAGSTRRCRRSAPAGARLVVVGLAPGLRGANRTGRPFTGDFAGEVLYPALRRHGFADGTLRRRIRRRVRAGGLPDHQRGALRAAGRTARRRPRSRPAAGSWSTS